MRDSFTVVLLVLLHMGLVLFMKGYLAMEYRKVDVWPKTVTSLFSLVTVPYSLS